jgi:DNA-binding NarL/FixJ family response regulator
MQRNEGFIGAGPPTSTESSAPSPQRPALNRSTSVALQGQLERREQALRVLLVEDSPLLVQRIGELVDDLPDIELAGVAESESEAIARLEAGDIDAVILDLQLHTGSGFGVLRALRQRATGPVVIVFTNFAIGAYRDTALSLGASHFLDKSRDYDRLPGVLRELWDSKH